MPSAGDALLALGVVREVLVGVALLLGFAATLGILASVVAAIAYIRQG